MAMDLIETAPFQRLRRIRQLGPAFLTFHGAESSRFTHSLGVLHLARLALNQLENLQSDLGQQRPLLLPRPCSTTLAMPRLAIAAKRCMGYGMRPGLRGWCLSIPT